MLNKIDDAVAKYFFVSTRSVLEFLILFLVMIVADPVLLSVKTGIVVSVLGLVVRIIASAFRYNSSEFMVRGPYRFVRHPHVLGSILILVGICLAGRSAAITVLSLVTVGIYYGLLIRVEEKEMNRLWGTRFLIFKAHVSAIFPQLIPAVPVGGEDKTYSLRVALTRSRMRELSTILGVFVIFLLLYWRSSLANPNYYNITLAVIGLFFVIVRPIYYRSFKNRRLAY